MKVLYLSHVSWNWTKQRPQFLAEELSALYSVTYVQKGGFQKETIRNKKTVLVKHLFRLPLARFKIVRVINDVLYKFQLFFKSKSADIIWFTSPEMYNCVPSYFSKKRVTVYDCMDDMVELYPLDKDMKDNEKSLYNNANLVFSSSSYLAEKLKAKYGNRDVTVVNNAISNNFTQSTLSLPQEINHFFDRKSFILSYVGSISSWMDFDLLKTIHDKFPQIKILLWGPVDVDIPQNIGVTSCGVVEHKFVPNILSSSDLLMMPFVVNELIKSVNPVKLYEYIYSGKPCIAPRYGESLQFGDFVYLYDNYKECLCIIEQLIEGALCQRPIVDCRSYVENNTWKQRAVIIKDKINTIQR